MLLRLFALVAGVSKILMVTLFANRRNTVEPQLPGQFEGSFQGGFRFEIPANLSTILGPVKFPKSNCRLVRNRYRKLFCSNGLRRMFYRCLGCGWWPKVVHYRLRESVAKQRVFCSKKLTRRRTNHGGFGDAKNACIGTGFRLISTHFNSNGRLFR